MLLKVKPILTKNKPLPSKSKKSSRTMKNSPLLQTQKIWKSSLSVKKNRKPQPNDKSIQIILQILSSVFSLTLICYIDLFYTVIRGCNVEIAAAQASLLKSNCSYLLDDVRIFMLKVW